MMINKFLQSLGVVFPKDCSFKNLRYLANLNSIPVFECLIPRYGWVISFIVGNTYFDESFQFRPLRIDGIKRFLASAKRILETDSYFLALQKDLFPNKRFLLIYTIVDGIKYPIEIKL